MSAPRPAWSNQTKLIVISILLVIGFYLLNQFGRMAIPLILAGILAYVLTPAVNALERWLHFRRIFAILITYLCMLLIIGGVISLVVPMLSRQAGDIGLEIREMLYQTNKLLGGTFVVGGITLDGREIIRQFNGSIQNLLQPIFGSTFTLVRDIVATLAWIVFTIVISIYLIKDTAALRMWLESLPPPAYQEDFIALRGEISTIWSSFFRGQIVLALIVAVLITTVYFSIGLTSALIMGVLAGLLEFMPSLGHGIWLCIALPLAFFKGSTWLPISNLAFMLIVLGIHVVFEQFDANYLIPRIIGRSVRLPPLVVILGIIAGASVAGVLGVMLAAPTIASLRVVGRYIYAEIVNVEPFPNHMAAQLPPPDPFWWRRNAEKAHRHTEPE
jgi:predicted PurR-regulated permease PerM